MRGRGEGDREGEERKGMQEMEIFVCALRNCIRVCKTRFLTLLNPTPCYYYIPANISHVCGRLERPKLDSV